LIGITAALFLAMLFDEHDSTLLPLCLARLAISKNLGGVWRNSYVVLSIIPVMAYTGGFLAMIVKMRLNKAKVGTAQNNNLTVKYTIFLT